MEENKQSIKKGKGKINYAIHGSQIIFRDDDSDLPFCSRLNYVVDRDRFLKGVRRVKSLQLPKSFNNASNPINAQNLLKNVIIEINKNPKEERKRKISSPMTQKARSKWTTLRSVFRAVTLFRTSEAQVINNEEDLSKALEASPFKNRAISLQGCGPSNFDEHFREERYYDLIAKGSPEDIYEIDEILHKDRRSYLHNPGDSKSLLNAPNRMGQTPLYIATKNGNLAMVKYLIGKEANPLIKSKVSDTEEESNLLVGARWKHIKLVEFYLEFYTWPDEELKKAKMFAGNAAIKHLLNKHMNQSKGCFFCIPCKPQKSKK